MNNATFIKYIDLPLNEQYSFNYTANNKKVVFYNLIFFMKKEHRYLIVKFSMRFGYF